MLEQFSRSTSACLDNPSSLQGKPLYLQVAYQLEVDIKQALKPGDFLDSEMNLARRFNVNRHTVRRAIELLVRAGLLAKQQGRGTQVVSNKMEYQLNPSGKFTKNLNELGKTAQATLLVAESIDFAAAPISVQRYFDSDLDAQAGLARLVTLRFMENVPVCVIEHFLSLKWLPAIHHRYRTGSLHQHINEVYGKTLRRQQIEVSATQASVPEALQLQCAVDSPLVILQSVNVIAEHQAVAEVSISHSRPDRLQYQINFQGD
jgi:GntR family phosphonate transport system transcriptional regulator